MLALAAIAWTAAALGMSIDRRGASTLTHLSIIVSKQTIMRYMLLCYDDDHAWEQAGDEALRDAMREAVELTHELHAKGQYVIAAPLHSVATATSVRVREGKPLITDGPFAETREHLGGFYLIEAADLDEAIRVAQRHPGARMGTVEIRPVMELAGLPQGLPGPSESQ